MRITRITAILFVVALLTLVACASPASSPTAPQTSTPTQQATTPPPKTTPTATQVSIITKNTSEIAFELRDFPAGWMLNKEGTEDGYFSRYFVQTGIINTILVCRVKVFATVDEAKSEYTAKLSAAQKRYSTDNPKIGDESFAYAENGYRCLFRKQNVIGITDMSTELYGGSLEDVISWGKQLVKKVF